MSKYPDDPTKSQIVWLKPRFVKILWDVDRSRPVYTKWQSILRELILELGKENGE